VDRRHDSRCVCVLLHVTSFYYQKAAVFIGFLVGFVCFLCVGNYKRALRALERQKQRRLSRLGGAAGESPKSSTTSGSVDLDSERQHLLAPARRRQVDNSSDMESLLFKVDDRQAANLLGV
jgi:hypothetical protein